MSLALLVLFGTATSCAPRDASVLRVAPMRHGFVIRDARGNAVTERELGKVYEERTGSRELRSVDHVHVQTTLTAGLFATAIAGFATAAGVAAGSACDHRGESGSCRTDASAAVGFGVGALGVFVFTVVHAAAGSPWDHDLSESRTRQLVDEYNSLGKPAKTSRAQPLIGPGGVGVAF